MEAVSAASCLAQDDTGQRLLLVAERRIERLEHSIEGLEALEALGALADALGGMIEPVGQRGRRRALLPPFCPLLAALLPVSDAGTNVLLDGRPEFSAACR